MATTTQTITRGDLEHDQYPAKPQAVVESMNAGFKPDAEPRVLGTSSFRDETQSPPEDAVEALERWNSPDGNMWRVFATFWSFLIVGMNDGSYGALVPFVSILSVHARCDDLCHFRDHG